MGGKNLRTRSSFRIDERHQIDFSPDCFRQALELGIDFYGLEHLLVTHSHDDHFAFTQLFTKDCAVRGSSAPITVYLQAAAARWIEDQAALYARDPKERTALLERYPLVPVDYFSTFRAGDLEVSAVKANHRAFGRSDSGEDEFGLNYLIRLKDGRTLLYATDTGWYSEETWEFLKGKRADLVIIEATFGGRTDRGERPDGHLDIRSVRGMLATMAEIGFLDASSRAYATHFNHKHAFLHDQMQAAFDKGVRLGAIPVEVAYDGLRIR